MTERAKRIVILSVRAGAGHMRAAEALETVFRSRYPDVEVFHIETLRYTNKAFRNAFTAAYERLAKSLPSVWGILYDTFEESSARSRTRWIASLFDSLNARPLWYRVKRLDPDAIICTHYLPEEILAPRRRRHRLRAPLYVTLTDYDIHAMWIQPGVDHYFVATEEMAYALREKGIEESGVSVSGIPIPPVFAEPRPDRAAVRERLGLPPEATVVLVSAGGAGLTRIDRIVSLLADRFEQARFLAVAGSNRRLQRALQRVADAYPENVHAFGFVDNMHELMAASDLAVAKCGGLTSSECMAMGLPMVIVRPIPGQEERNADYLLEHGVALRGRTHAQTLFKAESLLMDPVRMEEMARASRKLARPNAAYEIAALVMERLSGARAAERSMPAPGQADSVSSLGPAASISS